MTTVTPYQQKFVKNLSKFVYTPLHLTSLANDLALKIDERDWRIGEISHFADNEEISHLVFQAAVYLKPVGTLTTYRLQFTLPQVFTNRDIYTSPCTIQRVLRNSDSNTQYVMVPNAFINPSSSTDKEELPRYMYIDFQTTPEMTPYEITKYNASYNASMFAKDERWRPKYLISVSLYFKGK